LIETTTELFLTVLYIDLVFVDFQASLTDIKSIRAAELSSYRFCAIAIAEDRCRTVHAVLDDAEMLLSGAPFWSRGSKTDALAPRN